MAYLSQRTTFNRKHRRAVRSRKAAKAVYLKRRHLTRLEKPGGFLSKARKAPSR